MNNLAVVSMEILVTGVTACIWIVLVVVRILFPHTMIQQKLIEIFHSLSVGDLLVASIMMYNIGWVVHHLSEIILDGLFQTKYRRKLYKDEEFYVIRAVVFQVGSQSTMDDIKFDRHILRISRSNVLNFVILTFVSLWYIPIHKKFFITSTILCGVIALVSFFQWKNRYQSTYHKFQKIYNAIENQKNDTKVLEKKRHKKSRKK